MSVTAPCSILLLHSPLVGPATLGPLAESLRVRGHTVLCPDTRGAVTWPSIIETCISRVSGFDPAVVIGHSGAGAFVAPVARRLHASRQIFLDAVLPPETGDWVPSVRARSSLNTLARETGMLPPWFAWWNPNLMRRLVPNDSLRDAIESECTEIPLSLYDDPSLQPSDWSSPKSSAYIRLSGAYKDEAADARNRGWTVSERDGQHLDTATEPELVADLIVRVLEVKRVRIDNVEALRRRGGVTAPKNAEGIVVFAPPTGLPFAVRNECPHQGAELVASFVSSTNGVPWIECPMHSWRFDLATGVRMIRNEPSTDPTECLVAYPCSVDHEGMIWVEVPA
jgi:nitrite reductase/ring-hydroxylating ferredoxin subunit